MDTLISSAEIKLKIKEYAELINQEYQDKNLTSVMIMKGCICVTADLIREITVPFTLEFVQAKSYGHNGMHAGDLSLLYDKDLDIEGKDLIVIDDIFETGNTMKKVCNRLMQRNPKSIKTLVLLVKEIERKASYRPDYVLFDIPDRFVIGYGLDYKELFRGLPDICAFKNDKAPF